MSSRSSLDVLLAIHTLGGGGAERVTALLATEFARRGLEVAVLAADGTGANRPRVSPEVEVIDLGIRLRSAVAPLTAVLRERRPAAVLSMLAQMNVVTALAHRRSGGTSRLVLSERSPLSRAAAEPVVWWERVLPVAARRLYPRADAIIAVSTSVTEDLVRVTGCSDDAVHVIGNPVDHEALTAAATPAPVVWPRGLGPVVVAAGRMEPVKDHTTLLRAMKHLPDDVSLVLLGDGPLRADLVELAGRLGIARRCFLPGFVDNPFPALSRASVVASSSRYEGSPNVLIEALALGTPVVATDAPGGTAEILNGGEYGRLVPVSDERAMAEAIQETLQDPPSSVVLRGWAQRWALAPVADRYLEVLGCQ